MGYPALQARLWSTRDNDWRKANSIPLEIPESWFISPLFSQAATLYITSCGRLMGGVGNPKQHLVYHICNGNSDAFKLWVYYWLNTCRLRDAPVLKWDSREYPVTVRLMKFEDPPPMGDISCKVQRKALVMETSICQHVVKLRASTSKMVRRRRMLRQWIGR